MILLGYSDYYRRTIEQHSTGLKLVLGGTGLGKTSGIRDVVQDQAYQKRKFIYSSNRKQLIEEMAQMLYRTGSPPCYVVLPRDLEAVVGTCKRQEDSEPRAIGKTEPPPCQSICQDSESCFCKLCRKRKLSPSISRT